MIYLTQTNKQNIRKLLRDKEPDYVIVYRETMENITLKKYWDNIETTLKSGKIKRCYNFKKLFDEMKYWMDYNNLRWKVCYNINKEIIGVCK